MHKVTTFALHISMLETDNKQQENDSLIKCDIQGRLIQIIILDKSNNYQKWFQKFALGTTPFLDIFKTVGNL